MAVKSYRQILPRCVGGNAMTPQTNSGRRRQPRELVALFLPICFVLIALLLTVRLDGYGKRLVGVDAPWAEGSTNDATRGAAPWRSSHSAVLAMATIMGMDAFQTFLGSLRATGYSGHIILGITGDGGWGGGEDVVDYLTSQNVTIKPYVVGSPGSYSEYKISHARFFLYRDWIENCTSCTDGIMLTDFRDAYFQAGESHHIICVADNTVSKADDHN